MSGNNGKKKRKTAKERQERNGKKRKTRKEIQERKRQ